MVVGVNTAPSPIPLGEQMETAADSEFVQPHLHGTELARCRDNAGRGTQYVCTCLEMLTLSCRLSLIYRGQHNKDVNQASQPRN